MATIKQLAAGVIILAAMVSLMYWVLPESRKIKSEEIDAINRVLKSNG